VADEIEYEQFDGDRAANGATGAAGADMSRLSEIPMELAVEIGRTAMTVGETMQLRAGSVVELQRQAGEPVDLLVNGTPIARGEVVVIDDRYGLRIVEILEERTEHDAAAPNGNGSGPPAADDGAEVPAEA
jgi:flagellar motor switch protein FliN/FliY